MTVRPLRRDGYLDPEPPYQISPIVVGADSTAAEYDDAAPGNNFHLSSWVRNVGSRPTVAVFGEGVAEGEDAGAWGGNFVAYVNHDDAASAIGVEVNHGALTAGGAGKAYGIVIASAGDFAPRAHLQMQANDIDAVPAYGIIFHTRSGPIPPATSALLYVASGTVLPVGIDLSQGSYSDVAIKTGGGIQFPAVQVASTGVNVLDDYEEGTWTPSLSFSTPGNVAATYSNQQGRYIKIGRFVIATCTIITSAFSHTTASGNFRILGLPFTVESGLDHAGTLLMSGWTKAGYSHLAAQAAAGTTLVQVQGTGSGQPMAALGTADVPSGGSIVIRAAIPYVASQ